MITSFTSGPCLRGWSTGHPSFFTQNSHCTSVSQVALLSIFIQAVISQPLTLPWEFSFLKNHAEATTVTWGKRILLYHSSSYNPSIYLSTFPKTSDNYFAATSNKTFSTYLPRQKLHKQGLSFLQWFFFFFLLPFLLFFFLLTVKSIAIFVFSRPKGAVLCLRWS